MDKFKSDLENLLNKIDYITETKSWISTSEAIEYIRLIELNNINKNLEKYKK